MSYSKLNGIDAAAIASVNGIPKGSIASVNGATPL